MNDFSETLTRAKFEEVHLELIKKTVKTAEQALDLKDAVVTKSEIDEV
jgi:heat shock protein 5